MFGRLQPFAGAKPRSALADYGRNSRIRNCRVHCEEDCKILLKPTENIDEHSLYTFNYTPAQLTTLGNNSNCESLFCSVKVTGELTCTRAFVSESSRDITLSFAETTCGVYIPFAYHGDPNSVERWDTEAHFKNKKFRLDAGTYAWHRTTSGNVKFQIIPTNELSFVCISEQQ